MTITLANMCLLALATWRLTYELCFGLPMEAVRKIAGVGYDLNKDGEKIDRWGRNWLGRLLNCYSCTSILAGLFVNFLWWVGLHSLVAFLAVLGIVNLAGRWWITQRHKAEWWL